MTRNLLHSKASNLRHLLRNFAGGLKFRLLRVACLILNPKIALTYDASVKPDGVGAQVQRILAIRSLAHHLGFYYVHTGISSVAIHPFDSFNSMESMYEFVDELNHTFLMKEDLAPHFENYEEHNFKSLVFGDLLRLILNSAFGHKYVLIRCVEPYGIFEFDPSKYQNIRAFLPNFDCLESQSGTIAMHYRQGVGGKAIYPGQRLPRELDLSYFMKRLRSILEREPGKDFTLVVLTDAPKDPTVFAPPKVQKNLWDNSPNFSQGVIQILPLDFTPLDELNIKYSIISGGSPLEAIRIMSGVDHLLMGRSSLSFVAGVLNEKGEVFSAPDFWHNPLNSWVSGRLD